MPISGINAPVTMAGNIVIASAEILAGWVIVKTIAPKIKLFGKVLSGVLDMRTTKASFCSPEAVLQDAGVHELFKELCNSEIRLVPSYTDAKLPGLQSVYEKNFKQMALESASRISAVGYISHLSLGIMDGGEMFSPVQAIIDFELYKGTWKFFGGIEVNKENIALDIINEVGVGMGKNYLECEHTLTNFRRELWCPHLLDRTMWENGAKEVEKEKQILEKANEKWKEMIQNYTPVTLHKNVSRELEDVLEKAKRELIK